MSGNGAVADETPFLEALGRNPVVLDVLERAGALNLPDWYLTGGCLFQTVWNVLDGHDARRAILDYDLFYFDGSDRSWAAEDAVIRRARRVFSGVGGTVEVRNEARVHLWYEDRFGSPCPPFRNTDDAIDAFVATACCLGVRLVGGAPQVYAPYGFDDLFAFVLRPVSRLAARPVYEAKAARWRACWPRLQVRPWPNETASPPPANSAPVIPS